MERVQVETKGITRLAKGSLFRLTALRSLQHNSSLSSQTSSPLQNLRLWLSLHIQNQKSPGYPMKQDNYLL